MKRYQVSKAFRAEVARRFKFVAVNQDQGERCHAIRNKAWYLARLIQQLCPVGRHQAGALSLLELAVMRAERAIVTEEPS